MAPASCVFNFMCSSQLVKNCVRNHWVKYFSTATIIFKLRHSILIGRLLNPVLTTASLTPPSHKNCNIP